MGFKVVMHCDTNRLLSDRGLQKGGAVQCYIDSEVLHYCAPMVPHASGILEGSGETETVVGSGEVRCGMVHPMAGGNITKTRARVSVGSYGSSG